MLSGMGFTYIGPERVQTPSTPLPTSTVDFSDYFSGFGLQNTVPAPSGQNRQGNIPVPQGTFLQQYGAYLFLGAGAILLVMLMRRR